MTTGPSPSGNRSRHFPEREERTRMHGADGLGGASFLVRAPDDSRTEVTGSLWRAEAGLQWTPWRLDRATDAWWRKLWLGTSVSAVFVGMADAPPGAPQVVVHPSMLVGLWY